MIVKNESKKKRKVIESRKQVSGKLDITMELLLRRTDKSSVLGNASLIRQLCLHFFKEK